MRALAIVCLLAGAAHADVRGTYAFGVTGEYGTAYLPPTAGAGTATTISYKEYAGVVGNWILFIGSAPAKPMSVTKTSYETVGDTVYEVKTTYHPSQAAIDQWEKDVEEYAATKGKAILAGEMGQSLYIDVTARGLGGNASGFKLQLFRPIPGSNGMLQIGQYGLGWLTFHEVTSKKVVAEGGVLRAMDVVGEHTWRYVGMPIRLQVPFGSTGGGMHLQFDNNILGLFFDDASPIRLGSQWVLPYVIVGVEGVISGLRPDGYSINGSITVAL